MNEKTKAFVKHPIILGGTPLVLTLIVLFQARGDFKQVGQDIVAKVGKNTERVESLDKTMAVLGERVDKLTDAIKMQQNDHDKVIALEEQLKGLKERITRIEDK